MWTGCRRARAAITKGRRLSLLGLHPIRFDPGEDLVFERRGRLPGHPNGMRFVALAGGDTVDERVYYSVGGGFVATADAEGRPVLTERDTPLPLPFESAQELLGLCERHRLPVSGVMLRNERAWRPEPGCARCSAGKKCKDSSRDTRSIRSSRNGCGAGFRTRVRASPTQSVKRTRSS